MNTSLMRKSFFACLCGLALAGDCLGVLVLDCDTTEEINGLGTSVMIPSGRKTYTVELWLKPTERQATGEYRCLGQFSAAAGRMLVSYRNEYVGIFNGSGNSWTTSTTKLQANTWYHLACVFDETNVNKTVVYLNGVREGVNTGEIVGINDRYITLGGATFSQAMSGTSMDYNAFKGRIADVRIWTVPRSQEEIVANYQRRLVGDEAGLLAYWPLNALGDDGQTVMEAKTGDRSVMRPHYSLVEDGDLVLTPADHHVGGLQRRVASWANAARGLETDIHTSLGSSFTLETWARPTSANSGERWLLDQFYGTNGRFIFATTGNKPSFFVGGSTSGHVIAPDELVVGEWTHLALTRNGDDFTIYTNGYVAVTRNVPGAYVAADYPFCIGSSSFKDGNGNPRGVPFYGSQREVRVWSPCRTGEQIRETMGVALAGNEAGLRGYWPLDEGNGSNILNRVTGVACKNVVAEPIWNLMELPPVTHIAGPNLESAVTFVGDCHTGADTGTNITSSTYTLEAWIRLRSSEQSRNDAYVVSQFSANGMGANMLFGVHYDNRLAHLQDGHVTDGQTNNWFFGETKLPYNRWIHVAYVQDGSLRRLYVDGKLDGETDDGIVAQPILTQPLRIGYVTHLPTNHGRRWGLDGSLADVRFWNCARTAAEIAKFRTHRLSGFEPGLVGYWPMNDGVNGTLANLARGGKPGTVFAVWDALDDLSFGDPLKLGFSIILR